MRCDAGAARGPPAARRTAHADAVLAALGYKSDTPRATRAALGLLVLGLAAAALVTVMLVPMSKLNPLGWLPLSKTGALPKPATQIAHANLPPSTNMPPKGGNDTAGSGNYTVGSGNYTAGRGAPPVVTVPTPAPRPASPR